MTVNETLETALARLPTLGAKSRALLVLTILSELRREGWAIVRTTPPPGTVLESNRV